MRLVVGPAGHVVAEWTGGASAPNELRAALAGWARAAGVTVVGDGLCSLLRAALAHGDVDP